MTLYTAVTPSSHYLVTIRSGQPLTWLNYAEYLH